MENDIDIICITKCSEARVFNLIDSILTYTAKDTLERIHFICVYTGEEAQEVQNLEHKLSQGLKHTILQMPYNFAKCSNSGSKMGNGKYLLFLNDDIELKSDGISHCLKILESDTKGMLGTVGIKLLYPDNTIQHGGHFLIHENGKFGQITHYLLKQPNRPLPDYVSVGNTGAFMMIRREDFEDIGGFDQGYKDCFEDCVVNWAMLMKGKYNVTAASQTGIHYESTTRKQSLCKEDVDRLVDFFNANSYQILKNEQTLIRTIYNIGGRK